MGRSHLQQKTGFVILPDRDTKNRKGYTTFVDHNGLIQVVPRRPKERSGFSPVKVIIVAGVMLTLFKALALVNIGLNDYSDRLATLQTGTLPEQAGAWVLQIDPATQWMYQAAQTYLR